MLTDWVTAGGNLIALRPDKKLAGLLGLTDLGDDARRRVPQTRPRPGRRAPGSPARRSSSTAPPTATCSTAPRRSRLCTRTPRPPTTSPAVTLRSVGSNGGQAAAFTYDLARSVVYTRQGNPAWAGQERDGVAPIRPDDLFFGARRVTCSRTGWTSTTSRSRRLTSSSACSPTSITLRARTASRCRGSGICRAGFKAAVVMTGDDHAQGGTAGRFDQYIAASAPGCSVADWECVRSTSYVYPGSPLTNAQAQALHRQGFEVALHTAPIGINELGCANWTAPAAERVRRSAARVAAQVHERSVADHPPDALRRRGATGPLSPKVERANGIRLDTNYYYYPGSWMAAKPGFMTGSGMPMRFADTDGSLIDVYQANTEITDESGQAEPGTINALLDGAVGAERLLRRVRRQHPHRQRRLAGVGCHRRSRSVPRRPDRVGQAAARLDRRSRAVHDDRVHVVRRDARLQGPRGQPRRRPDGDASDPRAGRGRSRRSRSTRT